LRILHVGSYAPNATPRFRAAAMRRIGHTVVDLDIDPLLGSPSRLAGALRIRLLMGPAISAVNRAVLAAARREPFDLIWFDKPVWIRSATVTALRATGAVVVSYMPDNPYGPRGDPGWRLFLAAVPRYSVHVLVNPAGAPHYRTAGAPHVFVMPVPYEPTVHYPPPDGWSDADRDIGVGFVGSPYGRRADFLRALWRRHGVVVRVMGEPGMWRRAFDAEEMARFHAGSAVYNDDYRAIIWRTRINLGFVTHANLDSYAQRWFEIAGSAGFLLADRTDEGLASFADGREAAFFRGVDECAAAIRRYLPDAAARETIARAGHARAVASGYDNDSRLRALFEKIAAACPRS
jgi:hypothetical protein